TTPLWIALMEMLWPGGDRLTGRGWLGLLIGLAGVLLLLAPKLHDPADFLVDAGPLLVLGSAASWSLGSLVMRYRRLGCSHLTAAAYQMILGGGSLTLLGLLLGEGGALTRDHFTAGAAFAFFYLLIVGSLVGFVAFNWLLGQVSAAQAGTYAYVNPLVAVLVGLLDGEELTGWVVGGIVVTLAGVALVRGGHGGRSLPAREAGGSEGSTRGFLQTPWGFSGRKPRVEGTPGTGGDPRHGDAHPGGIRDKAITTATRRS